MIKKEAVIVDKNRIWIHSEFEFIHDQIKNGDGSFELTDPDLGQWMAQRGLEHHEHECSYDEYASFSSPVEWQETVHYVEPKGWTIFALFDSEDGPIAVYVKEIEKGESIV